MWYDGPETNPSSQTEERGSSLFDKTTQKRTRCGLCLYGAEDNKFVPQLRLWSRMVVNELHDDLEEPPNIPAFSSTPKRQNQPSVSNSINAVSNAIHGASTAINGATSAITNILHGGTLNVNGSSSQLGVSPGKKIELRMKNYEQLRYLQQLVDDGILTQVEYMEQKKTILGSLRNL